jgi:hypothetical protein
MQSSRESTATGMQSSSQSAQASRQTTVTNTQSNYYGAGGCYNCAWDSGQAAAGFAAGAIVGGAAVAATRPPTTTVVTTAPAPIAPPCNVAPVPVSGVPYYQCGAAWYAAGYGSTGVVYVPVQPPPGY